MLRVTMPKGLKSQRSNNLNSAINLFLWYLQVNTDGLISFDAAVNIRYIPRALPVVSPSTAFIALYWADVDTSRNNGRIYYRTAIGI